MRWLPPCSWPTMTPTFFASWRSTFGWKALRSSPPATAPMCSPRPWPSGPTWCLLLDVQMPGLDGYAVCARIRAEATLAAVPVIMVTGNYVLADVAAARRVGADDFLVKPFDPVVLLDKAKALLGRATVSPNLPGTPA